MSLYYRIISIDVINRITDHNLHHNGGKSQTDNKSTTH